MCVDRLRPPAPRRRSFGWQRRRARRRAVPLPPPSLRRREPARRTRRPAVGGYRRRTTPSPSRESTRFWSPRVARRNAVPVWRGDTGGGFRLQRTRRYVARPTAPAASHRHRTICRGACRRSQQSRARGPRVLFHHRSRRHARRHRSGEHGTLRFIHAPADGRLCASSVSTRPTGRAGGWAHDACSSRHLPSAGASFRPMRPRMICCRRSRRPFGRAGL